MVLIFQLLCVIALTMYKNMVCELLWICVHVILQTKTICTYIYCIICFYSTGLYMEGIYKVSGIKSKVQHLRRMYNIREAVQLSDFELPVITSLTLHLQHYIHFVVLYHSILTCFGSYLAIIREINSRKYIYIYIYMSSYIREHNMFVFVRRMQSQI